jgi:hypothetical protein
VPFREWWLRSRLRICSGVSLFGGGFCEDPVSPRFDVFMLPLGCSSSPSMVVGWGKSIPYKLRNMIGVNNVSLFHRIIIATKDDSRREDGSSCTDLHHSTLHLINLTLIWIRSDTFEEVKLRNLLGVMQN